jgi:hypothetical protein
MMGRHSLQFALVESLSPQSASWLPASYRAYAAQEDYRYVPGAARAQMHFVETTREIKRTQSRSGNVALALVLALIFGPIGMLYGSEIGAVVMAAIECIVLLLKQPVELMTAWMIGAAWSTVAVILYNRRLTDVELS